jgi:hypothetical protein
MVARKARKRYSRRLRFEPLEDRWLLSITVDVLDPVVDPGQDVPVRWEVAGWYVDTDSNGAINEQEVDNLRITLDALGAIKNQIGNTSAV